MSIKQNCICSLEVFCYVSAFGYSPSSIVCQSSLFPLDQKFKTICGNLSKQLGSFLEQGGQINFHVYFHFLKHPIVFRKMSILRRVNQCCVCCVCQNLLKFFCTELGSEKCSSCDLYREFIHKTSTSTKFSLDDICT